MTELLQYDNNLDSVANNKYSFDFVLLGMGKDGHIGSVFPRHGIESYQLVGNHLLIVKLNNDYPIRVKQRISIRLSSIINISKQIGLLLTGNDKCQIMNDLYQLKESLDFDHHDIPVFKLVSDKRTQITLYFDRNSMCTH